MKKRIIVLFIIMSFIFTQGIHVFADTLWCNDCKRETTEIDVMLNRYFQFRNNQFCKQLSDIDNLKLTNVVFSESQERIEAIDQLIQTADITIDFVETEFRQEDIHFDANNIQLQVYEWNNIRYHCNGHNQQELMGMGCQHEIWITYDSKDMKYEIYRDYYDESLSLGISTTIESDQSVEVSDDVDFIEKNTKNEPNVLVAHYYPGYNVTNAVNYANQWCGLSSPGSSSNSQHPANYNPAYYYETNDCANFVSQCLHAGGVATVTGSYETGWFYTTPPSGGPYPGGGNTGTKAWINVAKFDSFWRNRGITRKTGTSYIKKGNPVYWLNSGDGTSGHLMICTGFNSGGTPLVNAHNGDVYKYPVTSITSNTLYTLLFKCNHNWVYNGTYYKCSICQSTTNTIEEVLGHEEPQ